MTVWGGLIACLEEHTNPPGSEEAVKGGEEPGATCCGDKVQQQDSTERPRESSQATFYIFDAYTLFF